MFFQNVLTALRKSQPNQLTHILLEYTAALLDADTPAGHIPTLSQFPASKCDITNGF